MQDALAAVSLSLGILLMSLFADRLQLFCETFSANDWENSHTSKIYKLQRIFSGGGRRGTVNVIHASFVCACVLAYRKRKDYLFIA